MVVVIGLPLHLWCNELFKYIGDECGGFLEVDCNLTDVSSAKSFGEKGWESTGVYSGRRGRGTKYLGPG